VSPPVARLRARRARVRTASKGRRMLTAQLFLPPLPTAPQGSGTCSIGATMFVGNEGFIGNERSIPSADVTTQPP
jgi:hypothetical protein